MLRIGQSDDGGRKIHYNRDVRPILSENCFRCHGHEPKQRQSDLRLDVRKDAVDYGAIKPHSPEESLLVQRIESADPDFMMPPPESNKKLSADEKVILRQWIADGAEYQGHWAYEPLVRPAPANDNEPGATAIDALIDQELYRVGIERCRTGGLADVAASTLSGSCWTASSGIVGTPRPRSK